MADDMLDKVLPALLLLFLCCVIHRGGHRTHKHILPLFHMRLGHVL